MNRKYQRPQPGQDIEVGFGPDPKSQIENSMAELASANRNLQQTADALGQILALYEEPQDYRGKLSSLAETEAPPVSDEPGVHPEDRDLLALIETQQSYREGLHSLEPALELKADQPAPSRPVAAVEHGPAQLGRLSRAAAEKLAKIAVILNKSGEQELSQWLLEQIRREADHLRADTRHANDDPAGVSP